MRRSILFFFLLFALHVSSAAQAGKVEAIGPLADTSVSDAVRQSLEATGSRVSLADGKAFCDVWLRKAIPASDRKDSEAIYPQLSQSSFVGVISFAVPATDYRGQAIHPGFYTLRYEALPSNGDHLGVAPAPDFLLLIPAASDPDPDAKFAFEPFMTLSRKATGTRHPAPLSMVEAGSAPGINKDDQGHWVYTGKLKLASGQEVPFGLVVKGTAPQ